MHGLPWRAEGSLRSKAKDLQKVHPANGPGTARTGLSTRRETRPVLLRAGLSASEFAGELPVLLLGRLGDLPAFAVEIPAEPNTQALGRSGSESSSRIRPDSAVRTHTPAGPFGNPFPLASAPHFAFMAPLTPFTNHSKEFAFNFADLMSLGLDMGFSRRRDENSLRQRGRLPVADL